jgi:hypothetical protein
MKAFQTKFVPAKNTKGPRIKATCWGKTATVPLDYGLTSYQNHFESVKELIKKHNIEVDISTMVYGSHDFNNTYTFCFPQSTITL